MPHTVPPILYVCFRVLSLYTISIFIYCIQCAAALSRKKNITHSIHRLCFDFTLLHHINIEALKLFICESSIQFSIFFPSSSILFYVLHNTKFAFFFSSLIQYGISLYFCRTVRFCTNCKLLLKVSHFKYSTKNTIYIEKYFSNRIHTRF